MLGTYATTSDKLSIVSMTGREAVNIEFQKNVGVERMTDGSSPQSRRPAEFLVR